MREKPFDGSVAWITGASAGIGRALALKLAERGADVVVSARRMDRLATLATEIEALGQRSLAIECDVTQEAAIREAVGRVVATFGRIDIAVANAGFGVSGRIEDLSAEDWHRQLSTNVVGLAMTARYALPELRKTRGRLVLVGSVAAFVPSPRSGAYSASKSAVRTIGQTLAMETHGTGVTCTTLHPGYVESEIAQVDNHGRFDPSRRDRRPQPLMWPTERAAEVMLHAIHQRKREYVFTAHGRIGAFVGRHMPGVVHLAVTRGKRARSRSAASQRSGA